VILRGPLGFRTRVVSAADGTLTLETSVANTVERLLYAPATTLVLRVSARVRALQSGRLSSYLLYMLVALIVALSLVPILR
jgi:hypothetical protein